MKYENKSNGVIAELVHRNEKFKTVDLLKEDGKETTISLSTFKRWWKAIPEEETTEEEATKFVKASQTITKELNKNNSKSLAEMVEAQAKKSTPERRSDKVPAQNTKTTGEQLAQSILQLMEPQGISSERHNSLSNGVYINHFFGQSKKIRAMTYIQKTSIQFVTKPEFMTDPELASKFRVTKENFGYRYKITELTDENKLFILEVISDILENSKKEEK